MSSLDPNILTSVDKNGDRISIIPASVTGKFRRWRTGSQIVLLAVFLLLPWTSINGLQTILLNIPKREFALFGVLFRAHDTPLLFFILAILALGLAFITAIWGRVWCGWACPQTVFIDGVFRRIESWVGGSYIKRRALQTGPLTFEKVSKNFITWLLFTLVSSLIAHSFIAYFVGSTELLKMMGTSPRANWDYFVLVSVFTALILFDFGWFREQFCVIMCPYGRIQSVLLDDSSMAVVYDKERGEPRKGLASSPSEKKGDCVSCLRCVQVCPTGIDIRNGLQMECIACTACIDACDEIMDKVKKPKGLIRYNTLNGKPIQLKKPRAFIYLTAILLLFSGLSYALISREPIHIAILRGKGLPYSFVKGPENDPRPWVLNQFRLHIQNQSSKTMRYQMALSNPVLQLTVAEPEISLSPGESREWYFFVRLPQEEFARSKKIETTLKVLEAGGGARYQTERSLLLIGPEVQP